MFLITMTKPFNCFPRDQSLAVGQRFRFKLGQRFHLKVRVSRLAASLAEYVFYEAMRFIVGLVCRNTPNSEKIKGVIQARVARKFPNTLQMCVPLETVPLRF